MQFELKRLYKYNATTKKSSIIKDSYICIKCQKEFSSRNGVMKHIHVCYTNPIELEPISNLTTKIEKKDLISIFLSEFKYFGKGHNHKIHKPSITRDSYPLLRILKNVLSFYKSKNLLRNLPFCKRDSQLSYYHFGTKEWVNVEEEDNDTYLSKLMFYGLKIFMKKYNNDILLKDYL